MHLDHKIPWHLIAPHFSLTPSDQRGNYNLAALDIPEQKAVIGHFNRVFLATIREFSDTESTKTDLTPISGKLFSDDVLYFAERHFGLSPHEDNSALHNPLNSSHQDLGYWKRRAKALDSDVEPCYSTADANLADAAKMLVIVAATADDKTTRREALSALVRLSNEVPISDLRGLHWGHAFGLDLVASVALQMYIFLNLIEAVESRAAERVPLLSVEQLLSFLSNHALENYDFPAQNIPHRAFWHSLGVTESWVAGRRKGTLEGDKAVIDPLAGLAYSAEWEMSQHSEILGTSQLSMNELTLQDRLDSKAEGEIPASNRKLCGECLAISWNLDEYKGIPGQNGFENWTLNHHETLGELENSCMKGRDILHWNIEHNRGEWSLSFEVEDDEHMWFMEGMVRFSHVGSVAQSTARLVETKDLSEEKKKRPYVILSYCWGSGNDPARTSRNLRERHNKIECDTLSKTIQDGIRITRLMKIQYLWVDAVCIIQSDKTLNAQQEDDVAMADWERESMRMASYYSNSLCRIAASNAKDSSEGILIERRAARYDFKKWYNPANKFLPSPFAFRQRFPSSLFERGWWLQEWILSPRILHWTANESFGETRFGGENRKTNDCVLELGLSEDETQYMCQILRSEKEEALGEGWPALVEHFAQRHLNCKRVVKASRGRLLRRYF
ncbi:heterokaryon incompatibility protein-domain-containing protein [Fusarium oxysporum Fo47]|uniref:heterokaryon incompatibility protein-domain-containing protein n=1 Tax=Fusarium oxysporum Fo47 TaxID=660027 RepID=UPI002869D0CC|nr:heterokaryon incompatibility protein-domain-containing protein [Fusarium oxysporum Fo47]WJG36168.1 heterokaryon incompatibility protein-domain-containing protein [Fusarium oxysporum Fo47]